MQTNAHSGDTTTQRKCSSSWRLLKTRESLKRSWRRLEDGTACMCGHGPPTLPALVGECLPCSDDPSRECGTGMVRNLSEDARPFRRLTPACAPHSTCPSIACLPTRSRTRAAGTRFGGGKVKCAQWTACVGTRGKCMSTPPVQAFKAALTFSV